MSLRFGICVVREGGIGYSCSGDDNFLGISIYISPLSVPVLSVTLTTFLFSFNLSNFHTLLYLTSSLVFNIISVSIFSEIHLHFSL